MADPNYPNESLLIPLDDPSIASYVKRLQEIVAWMHLAMPSTFFQAVIPEHRTLIAANLIELPLQDFFTILKLRGCAIILCLDSPQADVQILQAFHSHGIKHYRAYVSRLLVPLPEVNGLLRVGVIVFTEAVESLEVACLPKTRREMARLLEKHEPELNNTLRSALLREMENGFFCSLEGDQLTLAVEMFLRARTRDHCQYELRYHKAAKNVEGASLEVIFAWRNTPKGHFLYRIARIVERHDLVMRSVNATYVNITSTTHVLVMLLGLDGKSGGAAWEVADMADFLRELCTVQPGAEEDLIDAKLVQTRIITGNEANFVRSLLPCLHQCLVYVDANLYRFENMEEAFCRHTELTAEICQLFDLKFHPEKYDLHAYETLRLQLIEKITTLDTGQEENDVRRRTILLQMVQLIHRCLKTTMYRKNNTAIGYRFDPRYLDEIPFARKEKFPQLPFGIFFIRGPHFFGFHVRFTDLARGGLRTVYIEQQEKWTIERNNVFSECYQLAYTQHKKNKDIPEGGSKGVLFLELADSLQQEAEIFRRELEAGGALEEEVQGRLQAYMKEQAQELLLEAQRAYVESLLTLVNCDEEGMLRAKDIIDFYRAPEYLYLGPDERMSDSMIEWIARYAQKVHYKPGSAFITSKPLYGINHKQYGVTSFGLHVYVEELLRFLGINPRIQEFSVKLSGGPDGDVAGNEMCLLAKHCPHTAKIKALIDISGTIYDPQGLDLPTLVQLFERVEPIAFYPPEKLHEGGFLLDRRAKREISPTVQQTLCWRKEGGKAIQDWVSSTEMNTLLRHTVHETVTDIFIPAGGRPRTLNEGNYKDFLDVSGVPTSKGIVEGANLYITPETRKRFEKLGVLIFKDSSANKGGVICSSLEVLCSLTLSDEEFLAQKETLVKEILQRIQECAEEEARLLLKTYSDTGRFMTEISDLISQKIQYFTDALLDYMAPIPFPTDPQDPWVLCLKAYLLPTLRHLYFDRILEKLPQQHKKAIVARYIAARLVYRRGLDWWPSIVDILPSIAKELVNPAINDNQNSGL